MTNPLEYTTEPTSQSKIFKGHTITLSPDWQFSVTGPEFDEKSYAIIFKSYEDATEEITKRINGTNSLRIKNINVSFRVLNNKGEICDITHINRSTGEIPGTTSNLYPNVPWVREALVKLNSLRRTIADVEKPLSSLSINFRRGYGHIEAEKYIPLLEALAKEISDKARVAVERGRKAGAEEEEPPTPG